MRRLFIWLLAALCITVSAQAQETGSVRESSRRAAVRIKRPVALPPQDLAVQLGEPQLILPRRAVAVGVNTVPDTLSSAQMLRKISTIYKYQSDLMVSLAEGKNENAEATLALAMTELSSLMRQPGIMDQPQFRDLYRSIVSEYERYYGVASDSMGTEYGDIFQFRADLFSALDDVRQPLLEDVMLPKVTLAQTTIPMTMNRLVEQSIAFLLRTPERHLYRWISRSETYFPMIEQILKEEGVPDEMKYLAMIESGLNPQAQSWAQAAGMWQFIAATGKSYGLEVNSWVDDRRDPEKATRAAARHLTDLYNMFGDWHLAMAAYNCGPGNVKKALRRYGNEKGTFWEIWDYLPKETRNYVPMYIATALVVSNPDKFNLPKVEPGPRYAYHYVPVAGMTPLSTVANMAGTDLEILRALNPHLKRNTVPPGDGAYMVRIPYGTLDQFTAQYGNNSSDGVQLAAANAAEIEYEVKKGDTIRKIAVANGISVDELARANNLKKKVVHAGDVIRIPAPAGQPTAARPSLNLASAKAQTVTYGDRLVRPINSDEYRRLPSSPATRSRTTIARNTTTESRNDEEEVTSTSASSSNRVVRNASTGSSTSGSTRVVYRVRRGDTLSKIAARYGVSVAEIKRWNRLRSNSVNSGRRLSIYTSNGESNVRTASTASSERSSSTRVTYRVRRGDNLNKIATKYGVTINDIREWNNISGSNIHAGQRLVIHQGSSSKATKVSSSSRSTRTTATKTYKVRSGDTLDSIARRNGMTVSELKKLNKIKGNKILKGQRLKVKR